MIEQAMLQVESADEALNVLGVTKLLPRTMFTIGRAPECDWRIDSSKISRLHAVLDWEADGYGITDKGSRNGTFVNHLRLQPGVRRILKHADFILLGASVQFRFIDPDPTEIDPLARVEVSHAPAKPADGVSINSEMGIQIQGDVVGRDVIQIFVSSSLPETLNELSTPSIPANDIAINAAAILGVERSVAERYLGSALQSRPPNLEDRSGSEAGGEIRNYRKGHYLLSVSFDLSQRAVELVVAEGLVADQVRIDDWKNLCRNLGLRIDEEPEYATPHSRSWANLGGFRVLFSATDSHGFVDLATIGCAIHP